jgi:hypothetical protein
VGDYTLCGFHFNLREDTPPNVLDNISNRINGTTITDINLEFLNNIFHCTSAYHKPKSFVDCEKMYSPFEGRCLGFRINTVFQTKYGIGIDEFVRYIEPWVEIDDRNKGCIGWTLSEYCDTPTFVFIKQKEDPKDEYIAELEAKLAKLLLKMH